MKKGKADRDSPGCLSFVWEICWKRLVVIYHFIAVICQNIFLYIRGEMR